MLMRYVDAMHARRKVEAAWRDYIAEAFSAVFGIRPRWESIMYPMDFDVDEVIEKTIRGLEVDE